MHEEMILLVEKASSKAPAFAPALERKGYQVTVAPSGAQALSAAAACRPAVVVLNAASLGSSGVRVCRQLADTVGAPVIHIVPADYVTPNAKGSGAQVLLRLPFTARKLLNRIRGLLPTTYREALRVGTVELITRAGIVKVEGRERRLTPKSASLLEVFLNNPGQTLDRGFLMQQVWDTHYVGDTRTLDVHVRWVREAIESNPAQPRFIQTVRGVGYRFDPDPA